MIISNDGLVLAATYDFNILSSNTTLSSADDIWNELVISHIVGYLSYCTLNNINAKNEYNKYKEMKGEYYVRKILFFTQSYRKF